LAEWWIKNLRKNGLLNKKMRIDPVRIGMVGEDDEGYIRGSAKKYNLKLIEGKERRAGRYSNIIKLNWTERRENEIMLVFFKEDPDGKETIQAKRMLYSFNFASVFGSFSFVNSNLEKKRVRFLDEFAKRHKTYYKPYPKSFLDRTRSFFRPKPKALPPVDWIRERDETMERADWVKEAQLEFEKGNKREAAKILKDMAGWDQKDVDAYFRMWGEEGPGEETIGYGYLKAIAVLWNVKRGKNVSERVKADLEILDYPKHLYTPEELLKQKTVPFDYIRVPVGTYTLRGIFKGQYGEQVDERTTAVPDYARTKRKRTVTFMFTAPGEAAVIGAPVGEGSTDEITKEREKSEGRRSRGLGEPSRPGGIKIYPPGFVEAAHRKFAERAGEDYYERGEFAEEIIAELEDVFESLPRIEIKKKE
jgi:hypothetical protein